jgi:hypothetical protein
MSIILITLFALVDIESSFSSSLTRGYILGDIDVTKFNKKVPSFNCYIFKTPSNFTKDIIIPSEYYFYNLDKNDVPFISKSNFTTYKRTCEFKIVDKHDGLGILFLYSMILTLGFITFVTTCLFGTEDEIDNIWGLFCVQSVNHL